MSGFMPVGKGKNMCLLIRASVMNQKGNMDLSLGKSVETVMFSVTERFDSVPRSQLRVVQLSATLNLCSVYVLMAVWFKTYSPLCKQEHTE